MICPRCESGSLDERDRDGITIDMCTKCRGVWLDRGELEKLIARATAELSEPERPAPRAAAPPPPRDARPAHDDRDRDRYREDRDRYRDDRPRYRDDDDDDYYKRYPKKRGFLGTLGELFD